MIESEYKEYGFSNIEEAKRNEWDYTRLDLDIKEGEKFELIRLDKVIGNELKEQLGVCTYETSLDNNNADYILDYGYLDFNLTNTYILRIKFDIVERYSNNEEENECVGVLDEDSLIKIVNVEII